MSNITEQIYINKGFKPVAQLNLLIPNVATAITDPGVPVNAILIKNAADISGGGFVYLGSSTLTGTNGFPLFDISGSAVATNTKEAFFLTNNPAEWYLISNFALGLNVRILYLAYNE